MRICTVSLVISSKCHKWHTFSSLLIVLLTLLSFVAHITCAWATAATRTWLRCIRWRSRRGLCDARCRCRVTRRWWVTGCVCCGGCCTSCLLPWLLWCIMCAHVGVNYSSCKENYLDKECGLGSWATYRNKSTLGRFVHCVPEQFPLVYAVDLVATTLQWDLKKKESFGISQGNVPPTEHTPYGNGCQHSPGGPFW